MLHVNTGRHYDTSLASHIGSFYTSGQFSPDTFGYAGVQCTSLSTTLEHHAFQISTRN